jgi:DNA-binding NarL/FixJ family response regulator
MNQPPIRIIIADDHELIREGLKLILSKTPEIAIVAEARNGEELARLAEELAPDVCITDIKMPVLDGIDATKIIVKRSKKTRLIALSFMDNEYAVIDMLEAGALGYLVKNADKVEIIAAIKAVAAGKPYFCQYTTPTLLKLINNSKFNPFTLRFDQPQFDDKERKIISLMCEGKTSQEIADIVFLSIRTIEGIRLQIMKKMDVRNTAGVIIYAVKTGLYKL